MTGIEYLASIERMEKTIKRRQEELKRFRSLAISSGVDMGEGVHASGSPDRMGEMVAKYVDMEKEIQEQVMILTNRRKHAIDLINSMDDDESSELLYKRYIENKKPGQISNEMGYCRRWYYDAFETAKKEINYIFERQKNKKS